MAVHQRAFPNAFMTQLGCRFLRRYYGALRHHVGGVLLVAHGGGGVIGFVSGCFQPLLLRAALRDDAPRLGAAALMGLVANPALAARLIANYRRTGESAPPDLGPHQSGREAELTSLAVDPAHGRRGVGTALANAFRDAAVCAEAGAVLLTTDAADNDAVRRFYERLGYRQVRSFAPYSGRKLAVYRFEPVAGRGAVDPGTAADRSPTRRLNHAAPI